MPAPSRIASGRVPPRRALAATLPAVLVVAAGALAYANSFDVPLQYDDVDVIVDAPEVHASRLSPGELSRAAGGFPLNRWLARASFAANHAVHGLRPFGYHAVNLGFHLGAALLVLAISRSILGALRFGDEADRRRAAAIAALLFAVHPVHTQAVTYVVQRMTSMGAFFSLAALLAWLAARERTGRAALALRAAAVAAAYLALACKESYAVLPALVLLVEWTLDPDFARRARARWRASAAAAGAVLAAAAWLLWSYWPLVQTLEARVEVPLWQRLLSQGRVLVHYLTLLALPLPGRLHVEYGFRASTGLLDPWTTLPALAAIAALVLGAVLVRPRAPLVTLAIGWFVVALSVEQSVFPIDLVFEHRLYFASVGLLLLAGAGAVRLVRVPRLGAWAAAAPLAAALAAATALRNADWRDPAILYGDAAREAGAEGSLLNVAAALAERGRLDEAEETLRRLVEVQPRDPSAYVNLGSIALTRGRAQDAERWLRRALEITDALPIAWYDLGMALAAQRRPAEAARAYEAALGLDPRLTDARVNLAVLRWDAHDVPGALALLDEAVRIDPGSVSAFENRAVVRALARRDADALADARRALELAPDRAMAHAVLAKVHAAAGRTADARAAAQEALRRDPSLAEAQALLRTLR